MQTFDEIVLGIMSGDTFLSIEGYTKGLLIMPGDIKEEPSANLLSSPPLGVPRKRLLKSLRINIGLIRRRLRDPNLSIEVP